MVSFGFSAGSRTRSNAALGISVAIDGLTPVGSSEYFIQHPCSGLVSCEPSSSTGCRHHARADIDTFRGQTGAAATTLGRPVKPRFESPQEPFKYRRKGSPGASLARSGPPPCPADPL